MESAFCCVMIWPIRHLHKVLCNLQELANRSVRTSYKYVVNVANGPSDGRFETLELICQSQDVADQLTSVQVAFD